MPPLPSKNAGDHGDHRGDDTALEVTVLSAESLRLPPNSYSLLGRRLRPYVSVSSSASATAAWRTRTDEAGADEPSWGDTLVVPVGPAFLDPTNDEAAVHVRVLSAGGRLVGPTQLGWCRIPAADVLDGLRPPGALRRLSYVLRCPRHGGGGHGVIHVAVRMVGAGAERIATPPPATQPGWCRVAIGFPVMWGPAASGRVVVGPGMEMGWDAS